MVAGMTRSDPRWGDGQEWDEERLATYERNTRLIESQNQLLAEVIKPWQDFADAMEESQRQVDAERENPKEGETEEEKIEREADYIQRLLYKLCHKHAFKEVREILQHTKEYMQETIEVLEERDEENRSHPAQFHRSSP
jgi:hypothetical protein